MPAAPQGNQSDNSAGILWTVAAIFAGIFAIWITFRQYLAYYFLTIKLHEAQLLSFLSDHLHWNTGVYDKVYLDIFYARTNSASLSWSDLMTAGDLIGNALRWPIIVMCIIFGVVVYTGSINRIYRRQYNMRDLAKLEKVNWAQISPVTDLDLIKQDINIGPWAMAMNPMQFCKRYRLLEEVRPQRIEGMSRKDWDRIDVVLKRGEANKIFALQLGPMWRGTKHLPDYARALFAVFAARINADSKAAEKILMQLNLSCKSNSLDMRGVDELMRKYEYTKPVQKIIQSHAYVSTVMAAMLAGAREDGVQASADFLWLKPRDRKLWYTLNTVGRQTPFIEVAGIFAHWVAEREAGRKLIVPMVEEATNAVELALKEIVYKRDEEG